MVTRRVWIASTLMSAVSLLTSVTAVASFSVRDWQLWSLLLASISAAASLPWVWRRKGGDDVEVATLRSELADRNSRLREQGETFEQAKTILLAELDLRTTQLDDRERDLISRFARFQEFLEYPSEDVHAVKVTGKLQQLSEQDRKVRQLLEAEAERVYEKIRRNGYTVGGKVDVIAIRDEAHQLIHQVAKIYKPDSVNPLLETSFDQIARAASRICLHVLVLLEQLPVNVQHYSINTLYSYVQRAVVGYGVYQKASPWLSYLTRGVYAGRMVASTNPATLGAWWLATELGKRGAKKVFENVVDRQAIALLHQLVTVIGVEAAGIYGTGFRQRDPSWSLGTELVELIHAFPASGESLKHGLQQVTALSLRSEYDRIYLYRCLANHRSAGLQLADPAMLTREERESIAHRLEQFFAAHIHGASEANVKRWRDGVEHRFDMKLKLDGHQTHVLSSRTQQAERAARSLVSFLRDVMNLEDASLESAVKSLRTLSLLTESQLMTLLKDFSETPTGGFEPPDIDPASDVTDSFLTDLAGCLTLCEPPDDNIELLVSEAWRYFRRSDADSRSAIENAWKQRARWSCVDESLAAELPAGLARAFYLHRKSDEMLSFVFGTLSVRIGESVSPIPNAWLIAAQGRTVQQRRAFVVTVGDASEILWEAPVPLKVDRVPGILLDDAVVRNGKWAISEISSTHTAVPPTAELIISGSIRGGRYKSYFKNLLSLAE